jgi:hypothetical protein
MGKFAYEGKVVNFRANSFSGCHVELSVDMQLTKGQTVWISRGEPKEVLYAIHMQGPDDVIAAPSKAAAEAVVKNFNQYWEDHKHERQHDVRVLAVVIEWPHGATEHAKDVLANFSAYVDLLQPFPEQRA